MNISRLKILRIKNDYKQSEIANILNISQSQYCKYELGLNLINFEQLNILANLYNTSIDYLLSRTNIDYPYPKIEKNLKN